MRSLSNLSGSHFHAFDLDGGRFLVAFVLHPNSNWASTLTLAPTLLPDPIDGVQPTAPLFYFESKEIIPGGIVIPVLKNETVLLRFDSPQANIVYVQDAHGIYPIPITKV